MWGRGREVFLFDMCPTGIVYTVCIVKMCTQYIAGHSE